MTRRTKIVCTLGPATSSRERIAELVRAGMDVARLNLSHGTHDLHRAVYQHIREASDTSGRAVGVLLDLQGPKIRLGEFEGGAATLASGAEFTITTRPDEALHGTATLASTTYGELARDVRPGDTLLIDDGMIRLEVVDTDGVRVRTRVVEGGPVKDHKGINLPGAALSTPAMTDKDRADLEFGLSLRVDMVALSFVRRPEDVVEAREFMAARGADLPIIVKLEKPEAVARLREIVEVADGLMVARGDLGVEMPLESVPIVQKQAILMARRAGKPVIVATQMLESMIEHSRPTRAEASDVANAILDGADAIMLSGETSVGTYPIESVRTMARICKETESHAQTLDPLRERRQPPAVTRPGAIAESAVRAAHELRVAAIAVFTQTGMAAKYVAKHRPEQPLLAFTTEPAVRSQLALVWGVETFIVPTLGHTDEMVREVERQLLELGRARTGDYVVIVAGTPPGRRGTTNMLKIHRLGDPT
jgi:pyruvate kinase